MRAGVRVCDYYIIEDINAQDKTQCRITGIMCILMVCACVVNSLQVEILNVFAGHFFHPGHLCLLARTHPDTCVWPGAVVLHTSPP